MPEITKIICTRSCSFSKEFASQKTMTSLIDGREYSVPLELSKRHAQEAVDSGWAKDISIERKILRKIEKKIDKDIEKKSDTKPDKKTDV